MHLVHQTSFRATLYALTPVLILAFIPYTEPILGHPYTPHYIQVIFCSKPYLGHSLIIPNSGHSLRPQSLQIDTVLNVGLKQHQIYAIWHARVLGSMSKIVLVLFLLFVLFLVHIA